MEDLNEQAQLALDRLIEENGFSNLGTAWQSVARQMWLVGFAAGMNMTKQLADEAFAQLERAL